MIIDVKTTKVYLISPGTEKYKERLLTVFGRLVEAGFTNITFYKSVAACNNTASLTNTVIEIFKNELDNTEPFFIIEDDCAFFHKYDTIELPDNFDVLYGGVSYWTYPHPLESLYLATRPAIFENSTSTVEPFNNLIVRVKGILSTHAILYNSREFLRTFIKNMDIIASNYSNNVPHDLLFCCLQSKFNVFALQKPLFYQDSSLGGQEDMTKLVYNGQNFCK